MSERSKILENFEKSGGSEFSVTEIFFADPTHVLHQIVFASRLVYWLRRGWIRQTNHEWTIKNPRKFRKIRGFRIFSHWNFFRRSNARASSNSFLHQGWFIDSGAVEFVKPTMSERSKILENFEKSGGSEFSVTEIFFAYPTQVLHQIVFASRLVYWLRRGWIRQTNHEWTIKNSRKFRKIRGFRIFSHWNFFCRSNARASSNRFCIKVGLLTQARLNSSNQPWVNDQKF